MNNVLGIHIETTGLNPKKDEIVSIALCSCDEDFSITNTKLLYRKGLDEKKLKKSYQYNKLSIAFLNENGLEEEEFIEEIVSFIIEECDVGSSIKLLGYNTGLFTKPFFSSLLEKQGINLPLSSNVLDAYSLAAILFQETNVNSLVGIFSKHEKYSKEFKVMQKCITFVNIFKKVKQLWNKRVLKSV